MITRGLNLLIFTLTFVSAKPSFSLPCLGMHNDSMSAVSHLASYIKKPNLNSMDAIPCLLPIPPVDSKNVDQTDIKHSSCPTQFHFIDPPEPYTLERLSESLPGPKWRLFFLCDDQPIPAERFKNSALWSGVNQDFVAFDIKSDGSMDEYRGGRLSKYADRDGSQRSLTSQYNRTFGGGIGHISENTFSLGESYNVKVRVLAETGDLVLEHVDDPNEEERSESICGKPSSFKSFLLQEPAAS